MRVGMMTPMRMMAMLMMMLMVAMMMAMTTTAVIDSIIMDGMRGELSKPPAHGRDRADPAAPHRASSSWHHRCH